MIADLKQHPPGYFNMDEVYKYIEDLPDLPKTELTPDGEQYVIPGAEREQTNVQGSLWS